ncbi:LysR substrate-binding domain-containing protein [Aromatoleum toluclasticum]|uniref:LysR substrate-binding domain-containing protein n=1 Tax=Aromatoleum toluclasticum TaxID=92003 RepID=UPI0003786B69|nr:LysR substrate-binding domain-containing protein [Aromatoleum toluclasticum]
MELRQLRYVIAIAKSGSLSKAAGQVFVAQSALSHQLAQLEEELGAPLFHRSRRGVEPTEAGRIFLAHATAILRQVEDARLAVQAAHGEPTGKVVFGIPHSVSAALALPLLQAVRERLPKVELELTEELTGNLVPQLRSGQLHLAVLFDDGLIGEFTQQPLLDERLLLISPAQAPDRPRQPAITLRTALALPLILPAAPHGVRPIIEQAARAQGLPRPNVVADISSISILRTSLLAGLGHTLLPPMPLRHELDAGLLAGVEVTPALTRRVVLCASRHLPLSAAADAVAALTTPLCRELARTGRWQGAAPVAAPD